MLPEICFARGNHFSLLHGEARLSEIQEGTLGLGRGGATCYLGSNDGTGNTLKDERRDDDGYSRRDAQTSDLKLDTLFCCCSGSSCVAGRAVWERAVCASGCVFVWFVVLLLLWVSGLATADFSIGHVEREREKPVCMRIMWSGAFGELSWYPVSACGAPSERKWVY